MSGEGDEAESESPTEAEIRELNRQIRRLQPGAVVRVTTAGGTTRRLEVKKRGTPEWMDARRLGGAETGRVMEGYGTTYLLQGYTESEDDNHPWLHWPSKEMGIVVWEVDVVSAGPAMTAEKSAADLLWRVERHGGR